MKKNSQTTFNDASISESNRRHILDILKRNRAHMEFIRGFFVY